MCKSIRVRFLAFFHVGSFEEDLYLAMYDKYVQMMHTEKLSFNRKVDLVSILAPAFNLK